MPSHEGSFLICLSPAPSNRAIIEAASGMHRREGAALVALFIETPGYEKLSLQDKQRLQDNMALAREFGADIEVVSGVDIPFQIAEYARHQQIFRIVMGQGIVPPNRLLPVPDFAEELLRYFPEAELHIIPDGSRKAHYRPHRDKLAAPKQILFNLLLSLLILTIATLLGSLFDSLHFSDSAIMMPYLLGVLLISIGTSHRSYSLVASVIAILLFNYFFVQPRFSLQVLESGYPVTLLVMFLTSFIAGTLAGRLKSVARQAEQTAYRTKIISDTDQMLAKCSGKSDILDVCSRQVQKLLDQPFQLLDQEEALNAVSEPVMSDTQVVFPLQSKSRLYAALSVDVSEKPIEIAEHSILRSILGECTLALENEQNSREKEDAAVQIENERMRSTLLRAISHDLRTPLTSISGNASNLLSHENDFDEVTRRGIYRSIYEDSLWLNQVVENLLASTRLENGEAQLNLATEVLDDIIEESVSHVLSSFGDSHEVLIQPSDELLLVKADSRMITQVLTNLLNNAIKYTPKGSTITIRAEKRGSSVFVSVADNGPGVPDSDKEKIFDMFYIGEKEISDSRRSLGFGLALCKTIVQAHGGEIAVSDNLPHGAVFTFSLPAEEVFLNG